MAAANQENSIRESAIRDAVGVADLNALRMTLYQLTGDPELTEMRVKRTRVRGGASYGRALAEEHHEQVKSKAIAYLLDQPARMPARPSDDELKHMMELFSDSILSDEEFRMGLEELALDEFPNEVSWLAKPPPDVLSHYHVTVIGAGISGLAAAVQLERLGISYIVLERQDGIGGTWNRNHYPDARVDVSSYMYQFKFEKNYRWTEFFATQAEVKEYLYYISDKYKIRPHIRLGTEAIEATWDEPSATWQMTLRTDGRTEKLSTNFIISASGLFNKPRIPDIPGIETFTGAIFHTTDWDDSLVVADKNVAVIGNGSSGTQLMPHLARQASQVYAFQRTPSWIADMPSYRDPVPPQMRWLFDNMPYYWNWYCFAGYVATLDTEGIQTYDPEWQAAGGAISERNDALRAYLTDYIRKSLGDDPELVSKCVPNYAPGSRRLVVDNGWYEALTRDNVALITDTIAQITKTGISTVSGETYQADVIILATGFHVSQYLWPMRYLGREGCTLEHAWAKDGARAYLGMVMPRFPNMFMLYGPNGQPRAGAFCSWAQVWARYVIKAITTVIESGHRIVECREDVFDEYNERLDMETRKWTWEKEGAGGYWVNEFGRSGVNMPWLGKDYHSWVIEPNLDDYNVE
jgi:4-hydroxyacetophenone monooxygenase